MSVRVNDVWTRKARTLGFPSRAVFKLIEAQKKFRFFRPGQRVVDLGCSPGSWTKLASRTVGRKGYVLGIDLNALDHDEVRSLGAEVSPYRIGEVPPEDQSRSAVVAGRLRERGLLGPAGASAASAAAHTADGTEPASLDQLLEHVEARRLAEENAFDAEQAHDDAAEALLRSGPSDAEGIASGTESGSSSSGTSSGSGSGSSGYESSSSSSSSEAAPAGTTTDGEAGARSNAESDGVLGAPVPPPAPKRMLQAEHRLMRARAPVRLLYGDVTEWRPEPMYRGAFDVVLSDMAPQTTGVPTADAAASADLCHAVLDLCPKIMKPPVAKWVTPLAAAAGDPAGPGAAPGAALGGDRELGTFERPSTGTDAALRLGLSDPHATRVQAATDLYASALERRLAKGGLEPAAAAALAQSVRAAADELVDVDNSVLKKALRSAARIGGSKQRGKAGAAAEQPAAAEGPLDEQGRRLETFYRGALLMKVFQGADFPHLLKRVKSMFVSVRSFKPESSRSESVELFLFAKGFRGVSAAAAAAAAAADPALGGRGYGGRGRVPASYTSARALEAVEATAALGDTDMLRRNLALGAGAYLDTDLAASIVAPTASAAVAVPGAPAAAGKTTAAHRRATVSVAFGTGAARAVAPAAAPARAAVAVEAAHEAAGEELSLEAYEDDEEDAATAAGAVAGESLAARIARLQASLSPASGAGAVAGPTDAGAAMPAFWAEGQEFARQVERLRDQPRANLVELLGIDTPHGEQAGVKAKPQRRAVARKSSLFGSSVVAKPGDKDGDK